MATLSVQPVLEILPDTVSKKAVVKVTGTITFTSKDRQHMLQGTIFRLECRLFGQDAFVDMALSGTFFQSFTGNLISATKNYSFQFETSLDKLDEDPGAGNSDEVYAEVFLTKSDVRKPSISTFIERKSSNTFHYQFGS